VSCRGDPCLCGVDSGRQVTEVPGQRDRRDGGRGGEAYAVVDALQRESLQRDGEVHREHVVSQSPAAVLFVHRGKPCEEEEASV